MFSLFKMFKKETKVRTLKSVKKEVIEEAWYDLFSSTIPVTFKGRVEEDDEGNKEIVYDISFSCTDEQWIDLRVELGIKGYSTT